MKVHVDPTKCKAYGACRNLAEDVFELDEWGYAFVPSSEVPEERRAAVVKAVKACPAAAISIDPDYDMSPGGKS